MKILREPKSSHSWTPWKLAIITGLSNPNSCELSWQQIRLLDRLEWMLKSQCATFPPSSIVRNNFPFLSGTRDAFRKPHLVAASFANLQQFLRCRSSKYAQFSAPHWHSLLKSSERFYLITGSCGLELVAKGLPSINSSIANLPKICILALGPVATNASFRSMHRLADDGNLELTIVMGKSDWIASRTKLFKQIQIAQLGHMGYWDHQRVEEIACEWLRSRVSVLQDQAVTSRPDK